MGWTNVKKAPLEKSARRDTPSDLWMNCTKCSQIVFRADFTANQNVCPKCQHHYPQVPTERLAAFLDANSFVETYKGFRSTDPLEFRDSKTYVERIAQSEEKCGASEAIVTGEGLLKSQKILVGVYDFRFMGGSMGAVVGEKIARLFQEGAKSNRPVVLFSSSGGARMQEGLVSLMQMAKTCAALSQLRAASVPLISVLTNPTTGGVAASYAMLGDINIGEPGALIGFAGPRVIQQTIGENLPEGFQRSEYLLEHGMLDMICHRETLRDQIASLIAILTAEK